MGTSLLEPAELFSFPRRLFSSYLGALSFLALTDGCDTECKFSVLSFQSYSLFLFMLASLAILCSYIISPRFFFLHFYRFVIVIHQRLFYSDESGYWRTLLFTLPIGRKLRTRQKAKYDHKYNRLTKIISNG